MRGDNLTQISFNQSWEMSLTPESYISEVGLYNTNKKDSKELTGKQLNSIGIDKREIEKFTNKNKSNLSELCSVMINTLNNVQDNYNDPLKRQQYWVRFKQYIEPLWNKADSEKSKEITILFINGIKNTKAETINKIQLEGFKELLKIIEDSSYQNNSFEEILKLLTKYKIKCIRFPKGASNLL